MLFYLSAFSCLSRTFVDWVFSDHVYALKALTRGFILGGLGGWKLEDVGRRLEPYWGLGMGSVGGWEREAAVFGLGGLVDEGMEWWF